VWQTPRGRSWARKIALRDLSCAEEVRVPAFLALHELMRQFAPPDGPMAQQQDDLYWELVQDGYNSYLDGKSKEAQFLAWAFVMKGQPNIPGLGWRELSRSIPPHVRGPLAYLFGRRYLRLNDAANARKFFEAALADADQAPAKSPLRGLARAEVERLKRK
jgi:hypothetical protein